MINNKNILLVFEVALIVLLLVGFYIIIFYRYLKRGQERDREILKASEETQEQTLQEVSHELHDNFGHTLSLINLNLALILRNSPDILKEKVEETKLMTKQLMIDLKKITTALNSKYIMRIGLRKAIEKELTRLNKADQFTTSLKITGNAYHLDPQNESILFRICQEIFNNIIEHARAKNIKVLLDYFPKKLSLKIFDDGIGFDYEKTIKDNSTSIGLQSIISRAKIINADLDIKSELKKGTTISISLPIRQPYYYDTK